MSVNFEGNQNIESVNVETLSTSQETQIKEEYNRSLEQYKAVMSTFVQEAACDGFKTVTKSKNANSKENTDNSDNTENAGILKKTTSLLADWFGLNENTAENTGLSTYDELLPSFGFNKTLKEYNMTLEALNF